MNFKVELGKIKNTVSESELNSLLPDLSKAHDKLLNGSGLGADYIGWVNLPKLMDQDEYRRIKKCAEKIRNDSQVLIVIGIGGSYLGARAAMDFIKGIYYNQNTSDSTEVYFAGNNLSADYFNEILKLIGNRDFSINVISKSGTTTEPAVAFRLFKNKIEEKYGKEAAKTRIYATTDSSRGSLKKLADAEGYETFVIPDNVGGRYSVLTPVGLLPMAVAGVDTDKVILGAKNALEELQNEKSLKNPAWQYAAARNALYRKGKKIEILACFEPRFKFMAEWWKQLFGESEGKENKGIFPASVELTADLHSMGQYIQQGERILLETIISFKAAKQDTLIPSDSENFDGLNYLSGRNLSYVNEHAYMGTALAHEDGGVPNITISFNQADEESFGYLVYFFEFSCGISGYLLNVNPFDQPGVEAYKTNMFALLGKPGYEERREELLSRIK